MENYRKIYEKYCKIKIPKNYEIHHIDMNRENNDIFNLVMLPKKLHCDYHKYLQKIETEKYEIVKKLQSFYKSGNMINNYIITEQHKIEKQFVSIWYECQKYVDYRDYLLGFIPNIHNIEV